MKRIWKKLIDNIKKKWNDVKKKLIENRINKYTKKINSQKEILFILECIHDKVKIECKELDQDINTERRLLKSIKEDGADIQKVPYNRREQISGQKDKCLTWAIVPQLNEKSGTYRIIITTSEEKQDFLEWVGEECLWQWEGSIKELEDISKPHLRHIEYKLKRNDIIYLELLLNAYEKRNKVFCSNIGYLDYFKHYYEQNISRKPKEDEDDGSGTGVRSKNRKE